MNALSRWAFLAPDWKDLIQIVAVAYLLYRLLLLLAGTRAMEMLSGLVLLAAAYFAARILDLDLVERLLSYVLQFGVIAALVVFQPELRSALARLGQRGVLRIFAPTGVVEAAEEIASAAEQLSTAKVGAIIVIERDLRYEDYVEDPGTPLAAQVSAPLLLTLFAPYSPLHDGATIVRGSSIVAAGVILPLTQMPISDRSLGTRHRAALGLSEETDALILVVSEETGTLSLAHRGALQRGLTGDRLRTVLAGSAERQVPVVG